ncbi:MAG: hypothetical protein GEU28_07020 [Dehalococcoidia bacterium]|nr:hypothetical protein [Dehalococcoidia bacterium]
MAAIAGAFAAGAACGLAVDRVLNASYSEAALEERRALPGRPLVLAALLATLFALAAAVADDTREFLLLALFTTPLAAVAITDIEARVLPNRIVYPGIVVALALSWAWPDRDVGHALIGGAVGFGFMLFPFIISAGRGIAAGDVKLAAYIGLASGWPAVMAGLLIGVVAGGVAAVIIGVAARSRRAAFAYGPFLALGGVIALWFGEEVVDWYQGE